jgi:hypothetical protein
MRPKIAAIQVKDRKRSLERIASHSSPARQVRAPLERAGCNFFSEISALAQVVLGSE